jgi:hypothetical protein
MKVTVTKRERKGKHFPSHSISDLQYTVPRLTDTGFSPSSSSDPLSHLRLSLFDNPTSPCMLNSLSFFINGLIIHSWRLGLKKRKTKKQRLKSKVESTIQTLVDPTSQDRTRKDE